MSSILKSKSAVSTGVIHMASFKFTSVFERTAVEPKVNYSTPLRFQITAVDSGDDKFAKNSTDDDSSVVSGSTPEYDSEEEAYVEKEAPPRDINQFGIMLYGVSEEGYSVSLRVNNFRPSFYVDIPPKCTRSQLAEFEKCMLRTIKSDEVKSCVKFTICERGKLYGYTNQRKFKVLRVEVPNLSAFWSIRKVLQTDKSTPKPIKVPELGFVKVTSYETNIEPLLRFFHARELQTAGWVSVPAHKYLSADEHHSTTCQLSFACDWSDVALYDKIDPSRQILASWDIEATSSHGDFPLAIKGYEKVAMDAYNVITNKGATAPNHSISLTELVEKALWPEHVDSPYEMSDVHLKNPQPGRHTSRIHRKPTDLLDKATAAAYNVRTFGEFVRTRVPAATPREMWENPAAKPEERVKILSDYLASRILAELPVLGDSVIQIGTCLKYLDISGKPMTSEKHIFVLGTCAKIPGINVYPCRTERELLLKWAHFIRRVDPDIMMGYNICGFDEHYIYERYLETANDETDKEFATNLSRIPDYECKLETKELTSAAMGQNKMSMMDIPGRIRIDLFHYIKRNYALDSYKLDAVAAQFMSSDITDCVNDAGERNIAPGQCMKLVCKSTEGLRVGQYIALKDMLDEPIAHKFLVDEVGAKHIICVNDLPDAINFVPKSWSQAKDDVHHKDIFRLHYGTAEDRAVIAKYCVQDCDLVLDLEAKLRAYMSAIAMANVCSVPVSYIFTRGQGVKIESLIFKECAAAGIIIKVLPKPRQNDINVQKERAQDFGGALKEDDDNDDEEEEESYEGAIVLKPKAGFYDEDDPVVVLDYASLYPSSMISENISHDSLVWVRDYDLAGKWSNATSPDATSPYDNIAGVRYIDIEFDILKPDPDDMFTARGKAKKNPRQIKMGQRICRYAQYAGGWATMGIILKKLLGTRKATRKLMEKEEKYSFMYNLLDTIQNAYKITANSLYGQLGSSTSKIRCVPLAASTTAYGRKQIMYSKVAIETLWGDTPRCNAECVYGDSVVGDTGLIVRIDGIVSTKRMDELEVGEWVTYHETKEVAVPLRPTEIWTERGFTAVQQVIRHRLAPGKKLMRVLTHTGVVDCTSDHSLVLANGVEAKPTDVSVGTALLHNNTYTFDVVHLNADTKWTGDKLHCTNVYLATVQAGYNVKIEECEAGFAVVKCNEKIENPYEIVQIYELPVDALRRPYVYDLTTENHHFGVGPGALIVHNTDSLFIAFRPKGPDGKRLTGWDSVMASVEIGEEAGHLISSTLKTPQDFEFDKVFWPFVLISKKRYIGHMYEEPEKGRESYKVKPMGIALKRRDNAPIVKEIYGGAVSSILKKKSIFAACEFIKEKLDDLASGEIPLRKLTISKSLKATYANRASIAHAVLADRIGAREPGSEPQSGDRMSFAYILPPKGTVAKTQGDRIETIPFIEDNRLKIDYMYYITNQILNPVGQFMAVMLESIPGFSRLGRSPRYYEAAEAKERERQMKTTGRIDERKVVKAIEKVRMADVQRLLFDDAIIKVENESRRQTTLGMLKRAS